LNNSRNILTQQAKSCNNAWFYDYELERTPFQVNSYENEPIEGMRSVSQLWENMDAGKDSLDVEIVQEWEEDEILFRRFYFTSRVVEDGKVRIYATYGAHKNKKCPALLHIHGGGQTVNEDWIRYLTRNGYAVLSIDWGGIWDHKVNGYARYPESLYYANHQFTDRMFSGDPSMFGSPWHEWCFACMRGISYLELQPEVNDGQIGIFGISMGGSLVWNVAAMDKRVKASVAIYGAGWAQYPDKYENRTFVPDEKQKIWLSGMAPEIYAQYIRSPLLLLSTTNDFHGNLDRICDTFDALPPTTIRRLSFGVSHNHHIEFDQVPDLLIWFDSHFKTKTSLPRNPQVSIIKGSECVPEVVLDADDHTNVEWVKMFYALENINPRNRYWQEETALKRGNGTYSIKAPIMNADKYIFAYASVKYNSGLHLSTKIASLIPITLQCIATADTSKTIYEASEGTRGWAGRNWATDPISLTQYYVNDFRLFKPNDGGVSSYAKREIITNRLCDPRFENNDGSKLMFVFSATNEGKVSISFGNEPLKGKPYSTFEKSRNYDLEKGETTILVDPKEYDISSWSDYPQIAISGFEEEKIKLLRIYWES
jgi:dienelactone hydrolase